MSLKQVNIERIQYSETQTGAYVLFLEEPISKQKLPIVIGGIEAHSITLGLEKDLVPQRPLTHDLMKSMMNTFHIHLKKVIINKYDQGIFYALIVTEKDGVEKSIDSRTSDAVALAVRFDAPIFCESSILDEAGIQLPPPRKKPVPKETSDLEEFIKEMEDLSVTFTEEDKENMSEQEQIALELFGVRTPIYTKDEIKKMLDEAIEDELYEKAAKLKRYFDLY